jgi:glycosyltransferase involved in cell wall biosynthesis
MPRATVAAVIPTKNVAEIIRPTLESLRFCDEVMIVDMFSTDDTRRVCESYPNVRFLQRQDYIYGNFNYGADQAASAWIIRLDSDEVLGPELQASIQEVLDDPNPQFSHYDAACHLYMFGMRLRQGYGAALRTVLFRKGSARYPVKTEHETLERQGKAGRLRGFYEHFTNPTIGTWIEKTIYYIDKELERTPLRPPQSRWKVLLNIARYFRGAYFGKGRLREDGYLGFVVALWGAFANALIEIKMWEKYEQARLKAAGKLPDHPHADPSFAARRKTSI